MAHGTVVRREAVPAGPERVGGAGWTAAWLTGAAALSAEGALALVGYLLAGLRQEYYVAAGIPAYVGYLVAAVITVVALGLAGLVGSAAVVLPLVRLSRRSARRAGRPETVRRCLAVCAAFAAAAAACVGMPAALLGGGWTVLPLVLLAVLLGLVPAVLLARAVTVLRGTGARFGLAAAVSVCGPALAAVVLVGGLAAYGTGLVQGYEPPRPTAAQLVGTWADDRGGTLTLRADGSAVAEGLSVGGDAADRCGGSGSWARGESPSGTPQLDLRVSGCAEGWQFGGTEERPTLYHWIGDPDSLNRYTLHRE
ncbi:hypothetical protein LG943_27005 [Streptomonospora sp. S1-112]|uniref:Uncharacterized protein n=1 Tax=Streptomonospora mangrovi TaxID=2883123 RepID=A0A9X3SGK6_9ACTN|nr:hypothetical protein [Streptomonospora mangrovi]MDA0567943.1 hypothetical protein [Streptomonospora mangrovi]